MQVRNYFGTNNHCSLHQGLGARELLRRNKNGVYNEILQLNLYETISLVASIFAVIIAAISLVGSSKNSRRQLDLEQKTADLAAAQLELIDEQRLENTTPRLGAELVRSGSGYKLVVSNIGKIQVRDIYFSTVGMPIPSNEFNSKVPIPALRPGQSVELIAVKNLNTIDSRYNMDFRWKNMDGSDGRDEILVFW